MEKIKERTIIEPKVVPFEEFPTSQAMAEGMITRVEDRTPRHPLVHLDVVYAEKDGMPLRTHVIIPPLDLRDTTTTFPLIMFVQGSAWQKQRLGSNLAQLIEFSKKGYVIALVEYRWAPNAPFPAQVIDTKTAIRFLYSQAETYHINKNEVVLWGDSSGGHTVAMTAVTEFNQEFSEESNEEEPLNIRAVIDFYGPTKIVRMNYQPSTQNHISSESLEGQLFGKKNILENQELVEKANPANYVSVATPIAPMLILHGDKDRLVPFEQSVLFYEALKAADKDVEFYRLAGSDHADDSFFTKEIYNLLHAFIQKNI